MFAEQLIEQSDSFRGLPPESRRAVARLCIPKTVTRHDTLFLEGERAFGLYLLGSGAIHLVKTSPDGKEVVIKTVEPGETFAEVALFDRDTYPVTAVALRKSTVYELPKRDFLRLLDEEKFRNDFIGMLARRLRYLADRILYLTSCDVEERFAGFLREHYGIRNRYVVGMAKKDLAAAIGTVPETLSRLFLRLRKQGKVAGRGKELRVTPSSGRLTKHPTLDS